jgi:hypothetical protein
LLRMKVKPSIVARAVRDQVSTSTVYARRAGLRNYDDGSK